MPLIKDFTSLRKTKQQEKEWSLVREMLPLAPLQPSVLHEMLLEADEKIFTVLYPRLEEHADKERDHLLAELNRQLQPKWNDPNLDPSWKAPDPESVRLIDAANGLLAERFAFCQTMPLNDFLKAAGGLRQSGYRPVRFRPYAWDGDVRVAAIWTRDGQDWQLESELSHLEVQQRDALYRTQSFQP